MESIINEIISLKNQITELWECIYENNRRYNQEQISETTHDDIHKSIRQLIDSKTWCILEYINKLEIEK